MKLSGKNITVPLARRIVGLPGHAASRFNRCVGGQLYGQRGGGPGAIRQRFAAAAANCRGRRGPAPRKMTAGAYDFD